MVTQASMKLAGASRFLRYFKTYRWELWLVVAIPFMAGLGQAFVPVSITMLPPIYETFGAFGVAHSMGGAIVTLILLAAPYYRVRRLERDFLLTLWGYLIALEVIKVVSSAALLGLGLAYYDNVAFWWTTSLPRTVITLFTGLGAGVAFLWFARRLTRVGVKHGFFLVAFNSSLYADVLMQGSLIQLGGVVAANLVGFMPLTFGLAVMFLKVWLLGNFEWRGEQFRKKAIIILVAMTILYTHSWVVVARLLGYLERPEEPFYPLIGHSVELLVVASIAIDLVTVAVLFGLVYLIRKRQPKSEVLPAQV